MISKLGVVASPNGEDALRLGAILADVVGLSLCFIGARAVFIILGSALGISLLFNVGMILGQGRETRTKLKNGEPVEPHPAVLFFEVLGIGALLALYILSIVDVVSWDYSWWNGSMTFVRAYAGMAGFVAFALHSCLVVKRTAQLYAYRRSTKLTGYCPHCMKSLDTKPDVLAREPSPLTLGPCAVHSPRVSFTANTTGEGENDNLIMKE